MSGNRVPPHHELGGMSPPALYQPLFALMSAQPTLHRESARFRNHATIDTPVETVLPDLVDTFIHSTYSHIANTI